MLAVAYERHLHDFAELLLLENLGPRTLQSLSLDAAKLGDREKIDGFRRLEGFVRTVETRLKPRADFDKLLAHEHALSPSLDGRSVFDEQIETAFAVLHQRT